MKCSLCGFEFNEDRAQTACSACAIVKRCKLIRCPNCGYETLPDPEWLKRFKAHRKEERKRKDKG